MSASLGTWSSISDVDTFFNRFSHNTAYKDGDTKLRIGNYITIQDGTYNAIWEIAGFDMEHNQTAADGTTYDNGYGICFIPKTYVAKSAWNNVDSVSGGYKSSYIHNTTLPNIMTNIKNILGSHVVTRNVLLSNSVNSNYYSNAYTWTISEATLMSAGQMTGTFSSNRNKYDDGEAKYKLPLFNFESYSMGTYFWTRGIWGYENNDYRAWNIQASSESFDNWGVENSSLGVRPLIYLR